MKPCFSTFVVTLLVLVLLGALGGTSRLLTSPEPEYRPVVLMHGIVGSASTMNTAKGWIERDFPGIYVHNAEIGDGVVSSVILSMNKQVSELAASLRADPRLSRGFNMVCHSQGGLLCRAYVERFNNPPVYNLMSWAGPNSGVYGVPLLNGYCPPDLCAYIDNRFDELLNGKLNKELQEHFSFASYWKDPLDYATYLAENDFLADINNERLQKNATYRENLISLNTLALQYSTADRTVVPRTSPWFEFYSIGQDRTLTMWNTSEQYIEDWIGMRTLDEQGRLQLSTINCSHGLIPDEPCKWAYELYTRPLLNNTL
mmetsp:Transcript_28992/g.72875  ORF Transcript_28992/g.72875 Transcript_28992/m.72875 type:complete len:315 (-) Transcript_28992:41-985(-)